MSTGAVLLLLDEPAAGMNPTEREELMGDIMRLRDELGYTVMVIEHDMNVIGTISNRVAAFDHGELLVAGPFDQVRSHPQVVEAYLGRAAREAAEAEAAAQGPGATPT